MLTELNTSTIKCFEPRNSNLNDFLILDSLEYQKMKIGITYLLLDDKNAIVSYMTLSMGSLKIPEKVEFQFLGRKLLDYPKDFPANFPALLIGKLATHKTEEGKSGASLLLAYAVKLALELREKIGCTYLVTHAYPESVNWYQFKGFKTFVKDFISKDINLETYYTVF